MIEQHAQASVGGRGERATASARWSAPCSGSTTIPPSRSSSPHTSSSSSASWRPSTQIRLAAATRAAAPLGDHSARRGHRAGRRPTPRGGPPGGATSPGDLRAGSHRASRRSAAAGCGGRGASPPRPSSARRRRSTRWPGPRRPCPARPRPPGTAAGGAAQRTPRGCRGRRPSWQLCQAGAAPPGQSLPLPAVRAGDQRLASWSSAGLRRGRVPVRFLISAALARWSLAAGTRPRALLAAAAPS